MHDEQMTVALDFISAHRMAVVATTAAGGEPECALVAYASNGSRLVIGTDSTTRKYENLVRNGRIAVVIGMEAPRTLQYEGDATELSGENARQLAALLLAKHPETAPFVACPTARTFLIMPRWLRFSDYSAMPPAVFEIRF